MKSPTEIEIWHDYVCPFCNVEMTRIARITEEDDLDLNLRFRPWPLEVANGKQPTAQEEDRWVQVLRELEPAAFEQWDPASGFWPRTSRHLFAAYEAARVQNPDAASGFDLAVRQAIFKNPRPLNTLDRLAEIAREVGLEASAFRETIENRSADKLVESAQEGATEVSVRSIPTIVLPDGSVVVSPGMKLRKSDKGYSMRDDIEHLRELLHKVAAHRH